LYFIFIFIILVDIFIKELGKGSQGDVWLCKEISSGLFRAVKKIDIYLKKDEIEREDLLLKKDFMTPYVVKYFGYFFLGDCKCFVMEYCENKTLAEYLKEYKNKKVYIEEQVFYFLFFFLFWLNRLLFE
jgi:serine/threonine protein kinase